MSYNFENLSSFDFEQLGIDLLEKHLQCFMIERFTEGKDWAIDGRFIDSSEVTNIIQCKHYRKFSDLKQILKKETERIKILCKEKKNTRIF